MANILSVGRDRDTQATLWDLLEKLGHQVHLAASAEAAIRVVGYRVPFDLAVVDTQPPDEGMPALSARLRSAWPPIPLVLGGDDAARLAAEARPAGAVGFLVKPFGDAGALERELARVLSRPQGPASPTAHERRGVVLVAEDNDILRAAMLKVLRAADLEVLEAESGEHALHVAAAHAGAIDVLVADVLMPGMTGTRLADLLAASRPGLKVLFVSGYPSDASVATAGLRSALLEKPFRHSVLVEQVRRLLA